MFALVRGLFFLVCLLEGGMGLISVGLVTSGYLFPGAERITLKTCNTSHWASVSSVGNG